MTRPIYGERLASGIVWCPPDERTDRPALAHVQGRDTSLLLDVGASPRHLRGFLECPQLRDTTPMTAAVLTHWHWDHCFGGSEVGVAIVAQRGTYEHLKQLAALPWDDESLDARVRAGEELAFFRDMIKAEMPDRSGLRIMLPQIVFESGLRFELGDRTCQVLHVGGDHSADSSVMWVAEERFLFLGDLLYECLDDSAPFLTGEQLRRVLDVLEQFEPAITVTGHGEEPLDTEGFHRYVAMFEDALAIAPTSRGVSDGDLARIVELLRRGAAR